MSIIVDALKWIQQRSENKEPTLHKFGGFEYAFNNGKMTRLAPSMPPGLSFSTLNGLVDYVNRSHKNVICRVGNWKSVDVFTDLDPLHQHRKYYAECTPVEIGKFSFGKWYDIEQFIIELQSLFVDTEDKLKVLKYASSISASEVQTSEDDGVSQIVTATTKAGRMGSVKLDPLVKLSPYRTFPELDQPVSKFLLRVRPQEKALPQIALFESDGGVWKIDAMCKIANYLTDHKGHEAGNYQVIC